MKISRALYAIFLFALSLQSYTQEIKKIKLKKESSFIYFFQKGIKGDTVIKNKTDLFYLLVADSLKKHISITIDNGRLQSTGNDSLYRLEYLPGLKYEMFYTRGTHNGVEHDLKLDTYINGTSERKKPFVAIKISVRREERPVLENVFYYKP